MVELKMISMTVIKSIIFEFHETFKKRKMKGKDSCRKRKKKRNVKEQEEIEE